jgi:hypothetical protein
MFWISARMTFSIRGMTPHSDEEVQQESEAI